ncbi:hypothetical protein S7711_07120 [Stachybotrys chartarum IBT 7711]|uniref:DUF4396 domain-containing protein n=1 Tax=Stachybotrys chartarum (strain CBS 109288 / IBT 7711) TaxID=1280523 RepID=A0A084B345_STACB|nr:hypothetical protein S7711_07120 [Stachybotrys chartarum IBT 7711]KFA50677.1 hypothetical protein S40293_04896 [Stachybotrys chartarum IBT 40293]
MSFASRVTTRGRHGVLQAFPRLPGQLSPQWKQTGSSMCLQKRIECTKSGIKTPCHQSHPSVRTTGFWSSASVWRRAMVNTSRCLVGCTAGDFSAMWYLQSFHPDLGMSSIMAISMASGITTSLLLETTLLRYGRDRLTWPLAAKTAAGMSMISMLTMELAENVVDYQLTGGVIQFDSPTFWLAAGVSMLAGWLTPLPYNYHRLRKYGRACH